jgi:hypothetical protein
MLPFNINKPKVVEDNRSPNFISTQIKETTNTTPSYTNTEPKVSTENIPAFINTKSKEFTGNEYINKNIIEKVPEPKQEQPIKKNFITVKIPVK